MKISHNAETLKVNEGPFEINVDMALVLLPWVSINPLFTAPDLSSSGSSLSPNVNPQTSDESQMMVRLSSGDSQKEGKI